jgi:hypothetical protein
MFARYTIAPTSDDEEHQSLLPSFRTKTPERETARIEKDRGTEL